MHDSRQHPRSAHESTPRRWECPPAAESENAQLPVDSGGQRNTSASACDGVLNPRVCRGRSLSSWAMASKSAWVRVRKSVAKAQTCSVSQRGRSVAVSFRPEGRGSAEVRTSSCDWTRSVRPRRLVAADFVFLLVRDAYDTVRHPDSRERESDACPTRPGPREHSVYPVRRRLAQPGSRHPRTHAPNELRDGPCLVSSPRSMVST
jgi:hypothetical protein